MILALSILTACILIALLLFVLPLGYSGKAKLVILLTSVFLGLLGVLGKNIFSLWELVLLQIVLALLFSYILNKRIGTKVPEGESEIIDVEIKPLFNMEELERKARTAPTVDIYYHSSNEEKEMKTEITEEVEDITILENESLYESSLQEEDIKELVEKVKTGEFAVGNPSKAEEDIDIDTDFIKEEEFIFDSLIMNEDEMTSNSEVAAAAEIEKEIDNDISEMLVQNREEIEVIPPGTREERKEHSLVFFNENEDDAEQLMKARMELFSELEEEQTLTEHKDVFKQGDPREQVVADNKDSEHLVDEEKIDASNKRSLDALNENLQESDSKGEEAQPSIEFDDLEEWYSKRKQKED